MVWFLQDLQQQIDAEQIAAPQLLPGIDLKDSIEQKRKGRRLYGESHAQEIEMEDDAFELHAKTKTQMLFREREVDNLQNMIYNDSTEDSSEHAIDSNRFTAPRPKLELF